MVAPHEQQAIGQGVFGAVGKGICGTLLDHSGQDEVCQVPVPRDAAEADYQTNPGQSGNLRRQMAAAIANLKRRRFISGRRATDDTTNPDVTQLEAVIGGSSLRL